jgi:lauroyl/myristoyl acyltransferase
MRVLDIARMAAAIPPRSAAAAASVASPFAAFASVRRARAWQANVLAAEGSPPASELVHWRPFYHHVLMHYESLAWIGGRSFVVRAEGEEHLRAALTRGGGLILATVHVGNWVLGGRLIQERTGKAIHTIAGTQIAPGWTRDLRLLFRRRGIRIHSREGATRRFLRVLRAGGTIALHLDGDQHARAGVATRGAALLSRRSGATILPGVCERTAPGIFVARFWPPMEGGDSAPSQERLEEVLMALVRGRGAQWSLFRPLWDGAA